MKRSVTSHTQVLRLYVVGLLTFLLASVTACGDDDEAGGRKPRRSDAGARADAGSDAAPAGDGSVGADAEAAADDATTVVETGTDDADGDVPVDGSAGDGSGGTGGAGDDAGLDGAAGDADVEPPLVPPPDPATLAPPLSRAAGTRFSTANEFLFKGTPPIQTGVTPGAIDPAHMAVIRGRVTDIHGAGLPGVRVGILGHRELGRTVTRLDGGYDIAVNAGGLLTVTFDKPGYPGAQRSVETQWETFATIPDVALVEYDQASTAIDASSAVTQVARATAVDDGEGARRATLVFPPNTTATMTLPDGSSQPLSRMTVRATEYTVGPNGPQAMPAALPPTTGYTYAVEFSVDEAVSAKAAKVTFSQPIASYTENFLGFPTGTIVPSGYYDLRRGVWVPAPNGLVIKVLTVSGGQVTLDVDGSGNAASSSALTALGITSEELTTLATLYTAGQSLWRVPIPHFSPWDFNMPWGPPAGARAPNVRRPKSTNENEDDGCNQGGSIIECQNQTLGESLPIAGTPYSLNYRSSRAPGKVKGLQIPLSGATLPAGVVGIELEVQIAGRKIEQSFAPAPNLATLFVWDGKDAYGRRMQGRELATVRVGYTYDGVYLKPSDRPGLNYDGLFGHFTYFGTPISANRSRQQVTLWQEFKQGSIEPIGGWDASGAGLGGWDLNVRHAYDPAGRTLYLGNGEQRTTTVVDKAVTSAAKITTTMNSGSFAPDGSFYFVGDGTVRKRAPDGTVTIIVGVFGQRTTSGDGGPATQAGINASEIALLPDGGVYVLDHATDVVRHVGTDGIIRAFAGKPQTNPRSSTGDGGPAINATVWATDIALAADGSLYIADAGNGNGGCVIRRVATDGTIRSVAGNGTAGVASDGARAINSPLGYSCKVAVGEEGSIYVLNTLLIGSNLHSRLHRVTPDGIIHHVGGNGVAGGAGDGGPATQASLEGGLDLAIASDGSVFVGTQIPSPRIRRIGPDGVITTVAGKGGTTVSGWCVYRTPGTHALEFPICGLLQPVIGPDGVLNVVEGGQAGDMFRVGTIMPGFAATDQLLTAENGTSLYRVDGSGLHRSTVSSITGAELGRFEYDANDLLSKVIDGSGNETTIERAANGQPTAIVGPYGHRTTLAVDSNGFLASVTNPAGQATLLEMSNLGLLTKLTDARGGVHTFAYDSLGRLTSDANPGTGSTTLQRSDTETDYTVTTTSALNRRRTFQVGPIVGGKRRTTTDAASLRSIEDYQQSGNLTTTAHNGTVRTIVQAPDPRWFMQAPVLGSVSTRTPGNLTRSATFSRAVTLSNPTDPMSLTQLTDTAIFNNRTFKSVYDSASRKATRTSAANRTTTITVDSLGRPTAHQLGLMQPTVTTYDTRGRVASMTIGSGTGARAFTFSYGASGQIEEATNPLGGVTHYAYDAVGRVTEQMFPDGNTVVYQHDANGNLVSITPPGKTAHTFTFTANDQLSAYTPPALGTATDRTLFVYDRDGQVTQLTRADGRVVTFAYDAGGRLSSMTDSVDTRSVTYDSAGRIATLSAPGSVVQTLSYDGNLPKTVQSTGPAPGSVGFTYNTDFQVTAIAVNGASLSFTYDADGLVTQAGSLVVTRDSRNGMVTGTSLGSVSDTSSYDGFGELASYTARYGSTNIYSEQITRDPMGRITQKLETIGGTTTTWDFTYDAVGQLTGVSKDGTQTASYSYDANGNRLSVDRSGLVTNGTYDARDRLTQYGTTTFSYTADGELANKTSGAQTTSYASDSFGNLKGVTLPSAQISYSIDALNRRVAKRVGGAVVQGFLYQDDLRPIAELDGTGAVVARFVYATGRPVPDYIVKGASSYRIIADHQGSPRLVVDVATGNVVERLDYDEFGRVLGDTNPGFQPFGFAGGIHDASTGLVLFGARSYDPETGRFTTRDPVLFGGDSTNLYAYTRNNPLNLVDPTGLFSIGFSAYNLVGAGAKFAVNGDGFSVCVEGGVGIGASLEVDPFGGLDADGSVTKAEGSLGVSGGITSVGVKGSATLDGSGCLKGKGELRLGPITEDIGSGDFHIKPKLKVDAPKWEPLGIKANAKVVQQRCWRAGW